MSRAHLFRPLQDEDGNLMLNATTVEVIDPVSHSAVVFPLYTSAVGSEQFDNPSVITTGYVDVWSDDEVYVSLKITPSTGTQVILDYIPMPKPEEVFTDDEMTTLLEGINAGTLPTLFSGDSAYDIAVANGFGGDVTAWLASLKGDPGTGLILLEVDEEVPVDTPADTVVVQKASE